MTRLGQSREEAQHPMKNNLLSAKAMTTVGTWNVRTLFQSGKMAQATKEFQKYRLDILGLTEVRWTGSGRIKSGEVTFLYSGAEETHHRGVGLMLSKEASNSLIGWNPVNERILTARLQSRHTKATVMVVYAPTEDATDDEKNDFYEKCQDVLNSTPQHDLVLLIGDMNALVSNRTPGLEQVIGPFGSAQATNDNGERLQMLCNMNGLCIGNTYFKHKQIHKKTWISPDGVTENEIDYICISKRWRSSLEDVKVCRGADVGSDHHLVRGKIQLKLKKIPRGQTTKPFAVERLKDQRTSQEFRIALTNRFAPLVQANDYQEQWQMFKETLNSVAEEKIGKRRGTRKEMWIKERTWKLIDERKTIKSKQLQARTIETKATLKDQYKTADREVKRSCRKDKEEWFQQKAAEAQEAANLNDTKSLYKIVKDLTGSNTSSTIPIKDKSGVVLTTSEKQKERWVEHFKEVLNQPTPSRVFDFEHETMQPELLVSTDDISENEVEDAVKRLKNGKAAGDDHIAAELLKHGGRIVIQELTKLLNQCWREQKVPHDWRNGVIVKLPKKGSLSECNNWRGVTLLSIPGKVLSSVLLYRLRDAVDERLRENQAGFRKSRSCCEQIFTIRNIIEQCVEFQQEVHINFVDFKKAFDSVHRDSLWKIVATYGIPERFINIMKDVYRNSSCCVKMQEGNTEYFNIETGVRQGCILSPFLFTLVIDFIMRKAVDGSGHGIRWQQDLVLADLDFADDIALMSESGHSLQELTHNLEEYASQFGLRINSGKTKVMSIDTRNNNRTQIVVGDSPVESVDNFTYLGSVLARDGGAERDIAIRVGKATGIFRKMNRIWKSNTLSLKIKLQLYHSIVLSTALYASETWKETASITKKLDVFHQRCLRRILKVSYREHITNNEILRRCQTKRLQDIVAERRFRFAGHVLRLPNERNAKIAMKWEPVGGKRKRGRPKITWRRSFQKDIALVNENFESIEEKAADRTQWKVLSAQCADLHGMD